MESFHSFLTSNFRGLVRGKTYTSKFSLLRQFAGATQHETSIAATSEFNNDRKGSELVGVILADAEGIGYVDSTAS
jgi:hypothetical protein